MKLNPKFLFWAVIFLLITNAVTIGTILYHNAKERNSTVPNPVATPMRTNTINGRFFRHTLGFSNEQMAVFREANHQFRPRTMILMLSIDSMKTVMFDEMQTSRPDKAKLDSLSARIGRMHAELKEQTYRFYLSVREVCDNSQRQELEKAFKPLFEGEEVVSAQGKGLQIMNN